MYESSCFCVLCLAVQVKTLLGPKSGGGANQEARRKSERERTTDSDVIMFSGCMDSQTSADATIDCKGGGPTPPLPSHFSELPAHSPNRPSSAPTAVETGSCIHLCADI